MYWLLVACASQVGGGGQADLDVDVAPRSITHQVQDPDAMRCGHDAYALIESMGLVYIVNNGPDPVQVDIYATHTPEDVYDAETGEWMDVSVDEDAHRNLETGGEMEVELWALGRCDEGGEDLYGGIIGGQTSFHYQVDVLLLDEPTTIDAWIKLIPYEG